MISASSRRGYLVTLLIVVLTAFVLWMMGRLPICACGTVKFWFPPVNSPETSQHLTDWYTLSHIIHGFLFYALLWLAFRRWSFGARLAAASFIECAWEIVENTPWIIGRYREATVSLGYTGDSIVNSMGDIAAMALGFCIASRLPLWLTVGLGIAMELVAAAVIHDNLTLNIVMLVWPMDFIKHWQLSVQMPGA